MSIQDILSSPLILLVAGGLGAAARELWQFVTSSGKREHDEKKALREDIAHLRERVDNLQAQVDSLQIQLRTRNTEYLALFNDHIRLKFQHKSVLGVLQSEGSEDSRKLVNRVLVAYGGDLESCIADLDEDHLIAPGT